MAVCCEAVRSLMVVANTGGLGMTDGIEQKCEIICGVIVELCGACCQSHLSFVFLAGTKNIRARKSVVLLDFEL